MRLGTLSLVMFVAHISPAQPPGGATVHGVVYDSLARTLLGGALVQLVPAETLASATRFAVTATADSSGSFALTNVPDGHYLIGFYHPLLDSLGLAPPLRAVDVEGGRATRVDLATPSPARLRAAICGAPKDSLAGASIVGTVRDARTGKPLAGARVAGEWVELSFTPNGVVRHAPITTATTGDNGWFALCNVPTGGQMALLATHGADSTDVLDLQVPAAGFMHRELYLGPARAPAASDTGPRMRGGEGRVSGTVVAEANGRPLAGAIVAIADGPHTRANDRGEWTLIGAPEGTRMLEVRSVGYYPTHLLIDVATGAAPVRLALPTLRAVLDTVMVVATPVTRRAAEFESRRRQGVGHFLTAADVARWHPIVTSDLFALIPGFELQRDTLVSRRSHHFKKNVPCAPAIWINGVYFPRFTASEINGLVNPEEIVGTEAYTDASVPPQYLPLGTFGSESGSCGSILIWTK